MYNISSVPKIKIIESHYKNIKIEKKEDNFNLFYKNKKIDSLNIKTNKEIKEIYSSYDLANGKILLNSFGFGFLPLWLATKENVKSIKIIEKSQESIELFLKNNKMPSKIKIEIGDIKKYKTEEHFDCIFLNFLEISDPSKKIKYMQNIYNNIPNHKIIWAKGIEDLYTLTCWNFPINIHHSAIVSQRDLSLYWDFFKNNVIFLKTFPDIKKEKINEYIYVFVNFLKSKYTQANDIIK